MRVVRSSVLLPPLLLIPLVLSAQDQDTKFQHLRIEDGLSQSTIWSLTQDSKGFMWFGSQDGLNRYDGYDIRIFVPDPNDPTSLSNNDVSVLYEDRSENLWIGTANGLNRYDRALERFTRFLHDPSDPSSLSHSNVSAIFEDHEGVLWVGTTAGGLNSFDPETGAFTRYQHDPAIPNSLSTDVVTEIFEDQSERLLVGTGDGLDILERKTGGFTHFRDNQFLSHDLGNKAITAITEDGMGTMWIGTTDGLYAFGDPASGVERFLHDPYDPTSLSSNAVTSIQEDEDGTLWIGTDGGGLNALNRRSGAFTRFQQNPYRAESLGGNRVLSIFEDMSGILWIGTYSSGADRLDRHRSKFASSSGRPGTPEGFNDYVRAFLVDRTNALWIGIAGSGLTRIDRNSGAMDIFIHNANDPTSLAHNRVLSLLEDREGTIWVGTSGGALNEFDPLTGGFIRHRIEPPDSVNIGENAVRAILEDGAGMLWIGTDGGGVHSFDRESGEMVHFQSIPGDPSSLGGNRVFSLLEDASGVLWIGTFGSGLNRFDRETGTFTRYQHVNGDPNSLPNDYVISLLEGQSETLWIGSNGGGLVNFDPSTGTLLSYGEDHGLANMSIYGILDDSDGQIWVSHNRGLSRFDPQTERFENFDVADGLQSNEFNGGAAYKSAAGELFFGGINGYNAFLPADIQDNYEVPPVVITDLQLYNRSVLIGDNEESLLTESIIESETLTLSHTDEVFSFEYAALAFGRTEKVEYAYIMEGFEDEWNFVGQRRFATYTTLPPGDYTFRVKASNGDGVWNEEGVSIAISILPPFWRTAWFISLSVLAALSLVLGWHKYRTRLMRLRAKKLEQRVEERTSELEREIIERKKIETRLKCAHREAISATVAKSSFLANMSHEIRTPMNGVLGMTQLLLDSPGLAPENRDHAETILASGEALLTIINDILDFSKIEAGKLDIEPIPFDLLVAASEAADLLAVRALEKGVELVVRYSPSAPRYLLGDAGRVRQVILNILGNALKFTAEGHVLLEVEGLEECEESATVKISIHDTGIGMDEEAVSKLFLPFSQADASTTRRFGGTGLGLAICKQLVELMGGEIGAESVPGQGSVFWFTLQFPRSPIRRPEALPKVDLRGVRILIVDDNVVNQRVLHEQLATMGMTSEITSSGQEALKVLKEAAAEGRPFPLAILDFLMPDMDGEQLGQAILADETLCHPALVLLTSAGSAGDGSRLEEAGFAGYLVKPARSDTLRDVVATVWATRSDGAQQKSFATRHSVAEARAVASALEQSSAGDRRWRVLVAEDNIVNQKVAKGMLEKLGCVVDVAANGEEALGMWTTLPYDIVFMDCQMPEMDGYEATHAIRKIETGNIHTPIIAMTANAMEGDRERCLAAGMDDYLAKPVRMDECGRVLEKWGGATSAAGALQETAVN